jgi:hypothetical protein
MKRNTSYVEVGRDRVVPTRDAPSYSTKQTRAADNTLLIFDIASLRMWERQLRAFTSRYSLPTVQFLLPGFSDLQNRSMSALAHDYRMECGCTSGSFFMSVTIIALLVSYFSSGGHFSGIHLAQVGSFLGITILSSLTGKLLGLLWARWQLLKLALSIYDQAVKVD